MKFYVSPQGNDSNGATDTAPWKTMAKVNAKLADGSIAPGDMVLFDRASGVAGNEFFGPIIPKSTLLASDDLITFGAYGKRGQQRRPHICTWRVLNTSGGWTLHSAGIWKIDLGNTSNYTGYQDSNNGRPLADIGALRVDGVMHGRRKWSTVDLANQWDFYCDWASANMLYVKSTANPTTLCGDLRASPDGFGAWMYTSHQWVGLEMTGAGADGIGKSTPASHIRIIDCLIHQNGGATNTPDPSSHDYWGNPTRLGNGNTIWIGSDDIRVENCQIGDNYDCDVTIQGGVNGAYVGASNISFRNNLFWGSTQCFEVWSGGSSGDPAAGFLNVEFSDNVLIRHGRGGWGYDARPDKGTGCAFQNYGWTLPANVECRRNVIFDPLRYWCQSESVIPGNWPAHDPAGWNLRENHIFLREGAEIKVYLANDSTHVNPSATHLAEDYVAYQAAEAAIGANRDADSMFHVLPSSGAPTTVSEALNYIASHSGSAVARAEALERNSAALWGEVERVKQLLRNPDIIHRQDFKAADTGGFINAYGVGKSFAGFTINFGSDGNPNINAGSGNAGVDVGLYRGAAGRWRTDGQLYAVDGIGTKHVGAIDGLTNPTQIDALFSNPPTNGYIASATVAGVLVYIHRLSNVWKVMASQSQQFTSSGSYAADAGLYRVLAGGGGGGGAGGGSAALTGGVATQVGGSGGGGGEFVEQIISLSAAQTLTVTVGAAGAGGAGGVASTDAVGHVGGLGSDGSSSTVTGTGVSVTALGGGGGVPGGANATSTPGSGGYAGAGSGMTAAFFGIATGAPGCGGSARSDGGTPGGGSVGFGGRGGGGGAPASPTLGGNAGGATSRETGHTGTTAGASASARTANTGNGGHGGGAGAPGGAAGAGAAGGSGFVTIVRLA